MYDYFSILNYYLVASIAYLLQSIVHYKSLDTGSESINRYDRCRN